MFFLSPADSPLELLIGFLLAVAIVAGTIWLTRRANANARMCAPPRGPDTEGESEPTPEAEGNSESAAIRKG